MGVAAIAFCHRGPGGQAERSDEVGANSSSLTALATGYKLFDARAHEALHELTLEQEKPEQQRAGRQCGREMTDQSMPWSEDEKT